MNVFNRPACQILSSGAAELTVPFVVIFPRTRSTSVLLSREVNLSGWRAHRLGRVAAGWLRPLVPPRSMPGLVRPHPSTHRRHFASLNVDLSQLSMWAHRLSTLEGETLKKEVLYPKTNGTSHVIKGRRQKLKLIITGQAQICFGTLFY